jgi:uncharacterized protein YoxC
MKVKKSDKVSTGKFSEIIKKEHVEHMIIIGLTAAIVILFIFLSYSMYGFYKTKAVATSDIHFLTGSISNLSEDKYQLIMNTNNLTEEIASLNATIEQLNNEETSLITEKSTLTEQNSNLTSQLDALQTKYDKQAADLASAQSDLASCQGSA